MTRPEAQKLAYNVAEACSAIGMGRTKLYELIKRGELRTFNIDGRTLIRADVLREFIADEIGRNAPVPIPALPTKEPTPAVGVYILKLAQVIVYVGRSTKLRERLCTHRASGRAFDEVQIIACDAECSIWLEKELIRTLQPTQNALRYKRHAAAAQRSLDMERVY